MHPLYALQSNRHLALDGNSEPLVGEAEACSVALDGTSVREPLRHPAATLGILESGNLDGDL